MKLIPLGSLHHHSSTNNRGWTWTYMDIKSIAKTGPTFDRTDFEAINAEVLDPIAQWESRNTHCGK